METAKKEKAFSVNLYERSLSFLCLSCHSLTPASVTSA
jgi:hypothetical protein